MGGNPGNFRRSFRRPVFRGLFPEHVINRIQMGSLGGGNPPHDGFDLPTVLDVGIISSQELVESFVLV